jgi:DNA-binding NarL/FixJ family response regulator
MAISVLIADDHPLVRSGIKNELGHDRYLKVVGEAVNGDEAFEQMLNYMPDVLILDLNMPGLRAVDLLRTIIDKGLLTRVLILTAYKDAENVLGMMKAGAKGYVLKDENPSVIVEAIKAVAAGKCWLSPEVAECLVEQAQENDHQNKQNLLTGRELETLRFLGLGCNNQEIAAALSISERTARFHVERILFKLGSKNRTEAVVIATKKGWI